MKDKIARENTRFRKSISVEERLVLTLRYLATGMSQQSLSFAFRIGKSTVGKILAETYQELYDSLKDTYLRAPTTPNDWLRISKQFEDTWNFPHVIEAIDGKHIRIECPKLSDSLYYNYLFGDDIFLLKSWLIRPFAGSNLDEMQKVYNYRQSRGRRVIENTFEIFLLGGAYCQFQSVQTLETQKNTF